jgi:diacylglycerol kinase family enzyme
MSNEIARHLRAHGHVATQIPTRLEPTEDWLDPALAGADVMVVVGGDGAVRMAADAAIRTGVPLHHLPLGTENLFAREFGSTRRTEDLLAAIEAGRIEPVDAATVNGETFLLMASMGFDADVVHDLAARRTGAITHLSYLPPIVRRAVRWRGPSFDVTIDDEPLVAGVRGTVVVANCRQYGGRLDPAGDASMSDGLLDVVVLPAAAAPGMVRRAIGCRLRLNRRAGAVPRGRGRRIDIRCSPASRVQVDGDPFGPVGRCTDRLECVVRPGVLPVLASARPVR